MAAATGKAVSGATVEVGVYLRVSTAEQVEGHSLDHQRDECHAWAAEQGAEVVEVYEDAGVSATSASRPAFQRMIEDAEAGRFDTLVVLKGDRFARSRYDAVVYKARLKKAGVRLVSVTEPLDDTPAGIVAEGMLEVIAEWYSADLKVKVTSGLRKRAEKGLMNGSPPFGYRQSMDPQHEPPVVVSEEAEAVRYVYERYATGAVSYREISAELNDQGHRTRSRGGGGRLWSGESVSSMVRNPVYRGAVMHKAEELPGRHEPVVSEELWQQANRVAASLRGRATSPKRRNFFPLAGIVKCSGCGQNLQGNATKSGEGYRYYRETAERRGIDCKQPQVSVRAALLEAEVDAIVARFEMPAAVRERVLQLLQDEGGQEDSEAQVRRVGERLRRLGRLYADLQIEEGDYEAERRALEAERDRLTVPTEQAVTAAETFDVLQTAWSRATPQEKRGLALALFEAIYVDTATKAIVDVVVQPAFRPWIAEKESK